ncbi:phosphodiester glycosidase family protein [Akkermansiaceae bacterium]|nr:phosphodiester glycosidase family protein [Akkermansiaceae bacterium]
MCSPKRSLPLAILLLCSCQPAVPLAKRLASPAAIPTPIQGRDTVAPDESTPPGETTAAAPALSRKTIRGIEFEGVAFDSRTHRLLVVDQAAGPGSEFTSAADAAQRHNALLAINAGFFTPEGKPLGLLVSNGRAAGAWNSSSSLGNGVFRETRNGSLSISRRNLRPVTSDYLELLQAGPLLLENGKSIGGLEASKSALRSIVLTDGGRRWWIGRTSSCTLAELGSALATASPAAWGIRNALNLDGGRSTDLFISASIPGGPVNRRGMLNRPVRNFLILKAR